jgi:hypothetical protein
MSRPSFQFYPADWRNNSKLRRCSEAARGAWVDVMCVLHDSDEYGVCRWPLDEVARAAGVPLKLVRELNAKDVLKGADKNAADYVFTPRHAGKSGEPVVLMVAGVGPCWYCSRFVRDEYIRQRRGQSTRFTSDNQPPKDVPEDAPITAPMTKPKASPKPPFGTPQGDGPSSSSSSKDLNTPIPPDGGLPSRKRSAIAFPTFLAECKAAGAKPIPDDDPVFAYAATVGIPHDFLRLQWLEFKARYSLPEAKRYKAWSTVFGKSVRGNWFRLWYATNDGGYALTTTGVQADNAHKEIE